MNDSSAELTRLKQALADCDAVLIGAGAGLSTAAGFTYSGDRFTQHFADFEAKYNFHDMYSGGFYPYQTAEERWAYWSRYVYLNRYQDVPKPVYAQLLSLVRDKDYFVLTTNVDHCFQKAGFDKHRLFYTQGDYGLFPCSQPCCQKTYDNEAEIRAMVAQQQDMRIPTALIPRCPVYGREMRMNLRADDTFVQDAGWDTAAQRYEDFLRRHRDLRIVYWELGVGYNTPGIIKYNFWQQTLRNPRATYVCMNKGEALAPREIRSQSICIDADIGAALSTLRLSDSESSIL